MKNIDSTGKIIVRFRIKGERFSLFCKTIEVYGTKLAFGDADGDLIKYEGTIIEVELGNIIEIDSK